jgi:hypothetical protein
VRGQTLSTRSLRATSTDSVPTSVKSAECARRLVARPTTGRDPQHLDAGPAQGGADGGAHLTPDAAAQQCASTKDTETGSPGVQVRLLHARDPILAASPPTIRPSSDNTTRYQYPRLSAAVWKFVRGHHAAVPWRGVGPSRWPADAALAVAGRGQPRRRGPGGGVSRGVGRCWGAWPLGPELVAGAGGAGVCGGAVWRRLAGPRGWCHRGEHRRGVGDGRRCPDCGGPGVHGGGRLAVASCAAARSSPARLSRARSHRRPGRCEGGQAACGRGIARRQEHLPPAGLDGREHQQHSTDPEEQQREATPEVPVGRTALPAQAGVGTSTAVSGSVAKEEPGGNQGKTENLYGATHFSSLQIGRMAMTRSGTRG